MSIGKRPAQREPGVLVLQRSIGVEILPGVAKIGAPPMVHFRLRHRKLPRGGVAFSMPFEHADAIAGMIRTVIEGAGIVDTSTTVGEDTGAVPEVELADDTADGGEG